MGLTAGVDCVERRPTGQHPGGGAPLSWMSPAPSLGSDPKDPLSAHRDLREVVNALHELDIEVWMQVRLMTGAHADDDQWEGKCL